MANISLVPNHSSHIKPLVAKLDKISDLRMSHPLEVDQEKEGSLESSQFLRRLKYRGDKCCHTWAQSQTESNDWSDAEEWKESHYKWSGIYRPRADLNSVLMTIEIFLVLLTLCSPVLICTVPFLLDNNMFPKGDPWGMCRTLCEIRLLSLCVKYSIMCTVIISLYAIRIRATLCCTERIHTSSSSWFRSRKFTGDELSRSKTALSLSESDRQNFPIYFLLDFLMASVTFVFWIHLIGKWHFEATRLIRSTKPRMFTAKNPFVQSEPPRAQGDEGDGFAVQDASDFVDAQLFVQIAGTLFLKVWQNSCGSKRFLVHVVRSPDCFSHTYPIGMVDVHSAAVHVIQCLSVESRLFDPLVANPKRRDQSRRSVTQSDPPETESSNLEPNRVSTTASDTAVGNTRRRRQRRQHRSKMKFQSLVRITDDNKGRPKSESFPCTAEALTELASRKETAGAVVTPYLGTIDQRELNSAAANRMNLQTEYDFLLLKRQARLKLLVGHWFQVVQTTDQSNGDKGPTSPRLKRMREAADLVFEHIRTPLLKYLRFTGQQEKHQEWSIHERLMLHLACRMSAESFLSPFIRPHPQLIRDPQMEYRLAESDFRKPANRDQRVDPQSNTDGSAALHSLRTRFGKSQKPTFQTWKLRIHRNPVSSPRSPKITTTTPSKLSINSFIHHGLRFEILRAEVTLICTVYRVPTIQLIPANFLPTWWTTEWTRPTLEDPSMPTSTIETCLGSSENFMEIRL